MIPDGYCEFGRFNLEVAKLKEEVAKLKAENDALWAMVDDFNEAVKRAAARLT